MSVHKDKSGIYIKHKNKTIRKNDKGERFGGKREAQAYEALLKTREAEKKNRLPLLSELGEEYLAYKKGRVKEESIERYNRYIKFHLLKYLDDKPIDQYTMQDIDLLRTELNSHDLATNYKNDIITATRAMFKYARLYHDLRNSVFERLDKFQDTFDDVQKKVNKKFNVWDFADFDRFYRCVWADIEKAMAEHDQKQEFRLRNFLMFFVISFDTGARKAEVWGLRIKDYDQEHHLYDINKQIKQKLDYKFDTLKNRFSIRTIEAGNFAHEKILEHIQYLKTLNGYSEEWFIFGGPKNLPNTSLNHFKEKYVELANVPDITIHEIRHSHATLLIDLGVPIEAVSKRLGHSNVGITQQVYAHVLKRKNTQLVSVWNDAISKSECEIFSKSSQT